MSAFLEALSERQPEDQGDRRWLFVPYDQFSDQVGPLAREDAGRLGIVLIETLWKPRLRPYHKQKLCLVLANQRHFALEQARRGVAVEYVFGEASYSEILEEVIARRGPLRMMEAAEYELRENLSGLTSSGDLEVLPNETWLTTREQFDAATADTKTWRMDRFYRTVRGESGILMEDGKPLGGKFSFDAENRKRWPGDPPAPELPTFPTDPIKQEVIALVERIFADHPGRIDPSQLTATTKDAEALWRWALNECLAHFGPYEDAMSVESRGLFHTRASALLNNGRLLPLRVVTEVEALDIPLTSKEGFIRQVLGWREFMRHIHVATDGFRTLAKDGCPNALDASEPLPPAFWGEASGLFCLDRVVEEVWETGYSHHITRLMVLSNLATLLSVDPREVADWFWVAYIDAYDWVVEPNVLGMGTFALGDLFVTKPYVSGAAYIDRMSDYCRPCRFSPKDDCPITSLYWEFLARNQKNLDGNPRVAMPLRNLERRSDEKRSGDRAVREWVQDTLAAGAALKPEDRP